MCCVHGFYYFLIKAACFLHHNKKCVSNLCPNPTFHALANNAFRAGPPPSRQKEQ